MQQLSLFDSFMEPLPTAQELEQRIKFMSNETWYKNVERRVKYLQESGDYHGTMALFTEFVVKEIPVESE